MAWDFETDSAYQEDLAWAAEFTRLEVEPLDYVIAHPHDLDDPVRNELIPPLQAEVRARGLWATHLGPDLGGPGYGQLKLALLNEIIGRSRCGPIVFGSHTPDAGNAETLARYGSSKLKERYLKPLLQNEITSAIAMTEPQGGSDPKVFTTSAHLDEDQHWVLNGRKWFSSNARFSSFLLVMAVTDPSNSQSQMMSMFIVPTDSQGVLFIRNVGIADEPPGSGIEGYLEFHDVRIPADHILGTRGEGFKVAQSRLSGGRIHHAMRTVGLVKRTFEMMCERAVSRSTQGSLLGDKQLIQQMIADSWIQVETLRLLTLQTAWKIDRYQDYSEVRADISAVKAYMQSVCHDVAARAIQLHGSLGVTNELPLIRTLIDSFRLGIADGPTEIHKVALSRSLLRDVRPSSDIFPTEHIPAKRIAAEDKYREALARARSVGRSKQPEEAPEQARLLQ